MTTVEAKTFNRAASNRDNQWVTPKLFGGGIQVALTIASLSILRGRPERFSSARPANPHSSYRDRHRFTFGRDAPASSAISALRRYSEASSTIRARCTIPADID